MSPTWSQGLPGDVAVLWHHPCGVVTAGISDTAHAGPAVSVLSTADGTERGRVKTAGRVRGVGYHEDSGLLLVRTDADRIHAVDPASGSERWAADAVGVVATTEKRVFLGADARVWAYRAADGTVDWERTLPDALHSDLQQHVRNDCLLVSVGERRNMGLVALDLDTGVERWYYRPGDAEKFFHDGDTGPYATFASDDRGGDVAHIDATTGLESWCYTAESSLGRDLYPVGDRLCLSEDSAVVAVDPVSGRERWRSSSALSTQSLWIENGTPYVAWRTYESDYEFHALDPDTGRSSWRVETDLQVRTIASDGSGDVYAGTYGVGGDDAFAYRIDGTTGRVHWQFAAVDSVSSIAADAPPTLVRSRSRAGRDTLFGIDAESGDPHWTLSDESLRLLRATPHLVAVSGSAETLYLVRREDGVVERTLDADAHATTDGALFVADGSDVAAYALTRSPAAFEGRSGAGADDTVVYVSNDDAETAVYSDTDSACPSCGSDLDPYGEISFCPDCGSDLSAEAE